MTDTTAEAYDEEGYFHTGDIEQFVEDGRLRIVYRVKHLAKLQGGEYIAREDGDKLWSIAYMCTSTYQLRKFLTTQKKVTILIDLTSSSSHVISCNPALQFKSESKTGFKML